MRLLAGKCDSRGFLSVELNGIIAFDEAYLQFRVEVING